MRERRKSKPEDNQLVYSESADPVERAGAIMRLSVDGFEEIEPLLVQLLSHESLFLRKEAVVSLVHTWKKPRYLDEAIKMLRSDPEWMVRGEAAFAASWFAARTGEQRGKVARELIDCLTRDESLVVQRRCYEGLLLLLAPERKKTTIPKDFDRERDVDWDLLRPYLNDEDRNE